MGKNGIGEGDIWTETGRSTSVSQERRVGRTCHTEGPASEGIRSEGAEELLTTSSKSWSLGPSLRFWFSRSGRNPDTSIFMFLKKIQYRWSRDHLWGKFGFTFSPWVRSSVILNESVVCFYKTPKAFRLNTYTRYLESTTRAWQILPTPSYTSV